MNTLPHYASLLGQINTMKSRISALEYDFKSTAARTDLDEQLIDALVASANDLITKANALKSVSYSPSDSG
tara:strand:- start:856 stop:1068 length:213 start_codon:yes stop_codon:yes gene_type:complete